MVVWFAATGIVMELVSFMLLAPQILGRERLQDWERGLQGWATEHRRFSFPRGWSRPLASMLVIVLIPLIGWVALNLLFDFDINFLWGLVVVAIPVFVTQMLAVVFRNPAVVRVIIRGLDAFLDPRRERLRSVVTLAGFALLFTGLTMQFVATILAA